METERDMSEKRGMEKLTLPDILRRLLFLCGGAFLYAAGMNGFFVPHKLLSTGINGIGMLIGYLTDLPIWLVIACLNVPVFIAAFVFVGRRFFWFSLFGMAVMTFFVWLTSAWDFHVQNDILAAAAGGTLCGAASGLMLRQGGSKGGVDIVAGILNRYFGFSYGLVSDGVNLLIVVAMAFWFGLEAALLTLAGILILNRLADMVLGGFRTTLTVLVVSRKKNNIAAIAEKELRRRASVLQNIVDKERPKEILMFIIEPRELMRLKSIIFDEDCDAEIMMINTKEVPRGGFERKGLF